MVIRTAWLKKATRRIPEMLFKSILLLVIIDITCITIVLIKIKTSLVSPNGILEMTISLFHWLDNR